MENTTPSTPSPLSFRVPLRGKLTGNPDGNSLVKILDGRVEMSCATRAVIHGQGYDETTGRNYLATLFVFDFELHIPSDVFTRTLEGQIHAFPPRDIAETAPIRLPPGPDSSAGMSLPVEAYTVPAWRFSASPVLDDLNIYTARIPQEDDKSDMIKWVAHPEPEATFFLRKPFILQHYGVPRSGFSCKFNFYLEIAKSRFGPPVCTFAAKRETYPRLWFDLKTPPLNELSGFTYDRWDLFGVKLSELTTTDPKARSPIHFTTETKPADGFTSEARDEKNHEVEPDDNNQGPITAAKMRRNFHTISEDLTDEKAVKRAKLSAISTKEESPFQTLRERGCLGMGVGMGPKTPSDKFAVLKGGATGAKLKPTLEALREMGLVEVEPKAPRDKFAAFRGKDIR